MSKNAVTDLNKTAFSVVERAISGEESNKNPAAVALGRLGGLKGGKARAEALDERRRSEIAQKAAQKRWEGHKKKS
jgi:hypothetical protein